MKIDDFIRRLDELLALAQLVARSEFDRGYGSRVDDKLFTELRAAGLSFLRNVYGEDHPYYRDFDARVRSKYPGDVSAATGVLAAVRGELAGGWLVTAKGLISAEIFGDFLEMAAHLLDEDYKDAAAVMVGGVLEEHLRQLAGKYGIVPDIPKGDRSVPKRSGALNDELATVGAYSRLDQKNVVAWLGLRNSAAHGQYGDYDLAQVRNMLDGVANFVVRTQP